jgi:hypothetical protein
MSVVHGKSKNKICMYFCKICFKLACIKKERIKWHFEVQFGAGVQNTAVGPTLPLYLLIVLC